MVDEVYDLETYPNVFTATFSPVDADTYEVFEISDRRNDAYALWHKVNSCTRLIGFNNMGFDWPILMWFMQHPNCTAHDLYERCQLIIGAEDRFTHTIWKPTVSQIDLFLMHHFNNPAKSTSLKKLQHNMRSLLVQDLPFPVGTYLSFEEIDILIDYNIHDVGETKKFWFLSQDKYEHRMSINPDWVNQSDTGLGRKFFEKELEGAGVALWEYDDDTGKRNPRGTRYPEGVKLADVILPYIQFRTPVLQKALQDFKACVVTEERSESGKVKRIGMPEAYSFELGGLEVFMGLGGVHACITPCYFENLDCIDLDVTGFYPALAIENKLYPRHLGPPFCDVMAKLRDERATLSKKTPKAKTIKDGMNSVFGSSGSEHTVFYDPGYMLGTTLNGQFLILSLAELLLTVPGLQLIQINTDGLTFIAPPGKRAQCKELWELWSKCTRLQLEENTYKRLWIRDVNNYIAEYPDGSRKLKGAYEPERQWHQNHSMPIIRKAAIAAMCDGADVEDFISSKDANSWDFLLRLDLSKTSYLKLGDGSSLRGVIRYYVSPTGLTGVKYMKATKTRIHAKGWADCTGKRGAWTCTACGETFKTKALWEEHADLEHSSKLTIAQRFNGEAIDYDMRFYVAEAKKLIIERKFEYGQETKSAGKTRVRRAKAGVAKADAGKTASTEASTQGEVSEIL